MMTEYITEFHQYITPDGVTYDLHTMSKFGRWVLQSSGWGMPAVDYISQQGPFQHGVSVRDFRLQPRVVQLLVRQRACNRDAYWSIRSQLLDMLKPNRDPIGLAGAWIARSQMDYLAGLAIYDFTEFHNILLAGVGSARLYIWDGANSWYGTAFCLAEAELRSLVVYDDGGGDDLYGGTAPRGKLFRFDTLDSGGAVEVAAQLNAQTHILDLIVFDDGGGDAIFGGTRTGGRLFKSIGGAWAEVAPQLGAQTEIRSLIIFDDGGGDDLYGSTAPNGMLYRWTIGAPGNWVQVCGAWLAQSAVNSLCIYNGQLYGGTEPNGLLFRYDIAGVTWEQAAAQFPGCTGILALAVYQGRLYGVGTGGGIRLLRWNNINAWEQVTNTYGAETIMAAMRVFNNRLFGGSWENVYLLEYIRRAGETILPCGTLRRFLSDGSIRDLCVHIQEGPVFSPSGGRWDEWAFQELLRFWAPDPIIYDPALRTGPAYAMGIGIINETQIVAYAGTWREHPTMGILGPLNNPVIRNEDTDEFIELDYNIPAGRLVIFTLTPGYQTVEDDLGVNLIGVITPESNLQSFHLAPDPEVANGNNRITIMGTGAAGATAFAIEYYNRYIGI